MCGEHYLKRRNVPVGPLPEEHNLSQPGYVDEAKSHTQPFFRSQLNQALKLGSSSQRNISLHTSKWQAWLAPPRVREEKKAGLHG
jgi:hypothetical protein